MGKDSYDLVPKNWMLGCQNDMKSHKNWQWNATQDWIDKGYKDQEEENGTPTLDRISYQMARCSHEPKRTGYNKNGPKYEISSNLLRSLPIASLFFVVPKLVFGNSNFTLGFMVDISN